MSAGALYAALSSNGSSSRSAPTLYSTASSTLQDMHAYWRWYTWLDPLHYAWTALVLNQYDGTGILYNGVTVRCFESCMRVSSDTYLGRASCLHVPHAVYNASRVQVDRMQ